MCINAILSYSQYLLCRGFSLEFNTKICSKIIQKATIYFNKKTEISFGQIYIVFLVSAGYTDISLVSNALICCMQTCPWTDFLTSNIFFIPGCTYSVSIYDFFSYLALNTRKTFIVQIFDKCVSFYAPTPGDLICNPPAHEIIFNDLSI